MSDALTRDDLEIVKRTVIHQGVFSLVRYHIRYRLFNNGLSKTLEREVLERFSAVAVLPYDPILDRVILIEQFRIGAMADPNSPWLIEIPAGMLDDGVKQPEVTAEREVQEETGCKITNLISIFEYFVSPGGSNEYLNLYCGKVDAQGVNGIHGLEEEQENIRVLNLSTEEAFVQLAEKKIKTSPAIIALLWLQENRDRLRKMWKK